MRAWTNGGTQKRCPPKQWSERVPVTRNKTTRAGTELDNGGVQTSCAEALPWGSLSPRGGLGRPEGTARLKNRHDPLVCECRKEGNKTNKKKTKRPADKRPKKGPQKTRAKLKRQVLEIQKNARGRETHPGKTQKQKDTRPKQADKQKEKDSGTGEKQKKKREQDRQNAQGGSVTC